MFFFLVVAQELIRTPTTGYPQNRKNTWNFYLQGKHGELKNVGKYRENTGNLYAFVPNL